MARDSTTEERTLIERMLRTIARRRARNELRGRFRDAEGRLNMNGYDIPPEFDKFKSTLYWPNKSVSVFAARQVPTGYTIASGSTLVDDVADLFDEADFGPRERMAIQAADELGISFVFTTLGDQDAGEPPVVFSAKTALTATCEIDPRTWSVRAALEVVSHHHVNLYLPGRVLECRRNGSGEWTVDEVPTGTQRVMCAPYIHGASLAQPYGRSRITQPIMDLTMAGMRTLLRQEVSGQMFMAPRPFLRGASPTDFTTPGSRGEGASPWSILTGEVWAVPDISVDDDPDAPDALRRVDLSTIPQMTMQPFSEQFRLIAAAVSGAASIPLSYLGVVQDSNPTSAQAIEASEIDLIREVRAQNPSLGIGRKAVALNALALLYGDFSRAVLDEVRGLRATWEDPRTRSMSEQSQMVALQVQNGNMQPGTAATVRQLPLSPEDVATVVSENQRAAGNGILDRALAAAAVPESGATATPAVAGADGPKLQDRANTFGILIRSGATPESAARVAAGEIDIAQLEMRPGVLPVTVRSEAAD